MILHGVNQGIDVEIGGGTPYAAILIPGIGPIFSPVGLGLLVGFEAKSSLKMTREKKKQFNS